MFCFNYPMALLNTQMHYEWGSRDGLERHFSIPREKDLPQAELWIGAHARAPSLAILKNGTKIALDILTANNKNDILGSEDRSFPFLFKLLSAARPLSVQVHPNKKQAAEGYNRENMEGIAKDAFTRNYRDSNHKPELLYAVTPFKALCGFRPLSEIRRHIGLLSENGVVLPRYLKQPFSPDELLRVLLVWMLSMSPEESKTIIPQIVALAKRLKRDPAFDTLLTLCHFYPDDNTVLSALWMNLIELQPGEALFVKPGCPHSYIRGTGIEVMAPSDNVLRGGLTNKHIDIAEFCDIVSFEPSSADILTPHVSANMTIFPVPVDDFSFTLVNLNNEFHKPRGWLVILFCMEGHVISEGGGVIITLKKGESCLLPASSSVKIWGNGKVAMITPGELSPLDVFLNDTP